jgi:hypothetical protein
MNHREHETRESSAIRESVSGADIREGVCIIRAFAGDGSPEVIELDGLFFDRRETGEALTSLLAAARETITIIRSRIYDDVRYRDLREFIDGALATKT